MASPCARANGASESITCRGLTRKGRLRGAGNRAVAGRLAAADSTAWNTREQAKHDRRREDCEMAETLQKSLGDPGCSILPRGSHERLVLLPGTILRVEAASDDGVSLRVLPERSPLAEEDR